MKKIFVNTEEARLRTGWRIAAMIAMFFAISFSVLGGIEFVNGGRPDLPPLLLNLVAICTAAVAGTISVLVARHYLDKKTFVSFGLQMNRQAFKDTFAGFCLSGAMAGSIFVVMVLMGQIDVSGITWSNSLPQLSDFSGKTEYFTKMGLGVLGINLLLFTVVSWWEELVFRGYLLQNMMEGMGTILAVIVSCLIYGLVHATNPNATLLSSSIIVLFGFLRLYGFLATGALWLSFGMHMGWNFFQGPVFGYSASGLEFVSVINQEPSGPNWLSGGNFGPEGSVLAIPVIGLALICMYLWAKHTKSQQVSA